MHNCFKQKATWDEAAQLLIRTIDSQLFIAHYIDKHTLTVDRTIIIRISFQHIIQLGMSFA